jgi:hypothetical protein
MSTARLTRTAAALLAFSRTFLVAAPRSDCDRACLRTTLDRYLQAVTTHDSSAAPLAAGSRETDNAVVVLPGTGVWKTVSALGAVQRRFFDTGAGQAAYFGTVLENDNPAVVTVRIRVQSRRITQAEWIIARKGALGATVNPALFDAENLAATPPPDRVASRESRLSRQEMVAVANSYFDGVNTREASIIHAHPGCLRVENGVTATGRALQPGQVQVNGLPTTDCTTNLGANVQNVASRRYPLVDEEAGVVLGIAVFARKAGAPERRLVLSEFFFLEGQKIRSMYEALYYPPSEALVPNWPPYDGN